MLACCKHTVATTCYCFCYHNCCYFHPESSWASIPLKNLSFLICQMGIIIIYSCLKTRSSFKVFSNSRRPLWFKHNHIMLMANILTAFSICQVLFLVLFVSCLIINSGIRQVLFLMLFYRWINWNMKRLNNLFNKTYSSRVRIWTLAAWYKHLYILNLVTLLSLKPGHQREANYIISAIRCSIWYIIATAGNIQTVGSQI